MRRQMHSRSESAQAWTGGYNSRGSKQIQSIILSEFQCLQTFLTAMAILQQKNIINRRFGMLGTML